MSGKQRPRDVASTAAPCKIENDNHGRAPGIATFGFESQNRSALGGEAQQAQDAPAVRHDSFAVNPDFGLERVCQRHEFIGGSQVESEDVTNTHSATGDMKVLSHWELTPISRIPAHFPANNRKGVVAQKY